MIFYQRFIKHFSGIIAPITQQTHQHKRFQWSQEAQEAFDKLKALFTSAPILKHPDPALPYVLSQLKGPKALLHPVAFFSQKLSQTERNYDVGDRELLAIKAALKECGIYLKAQTIRTLNISDPPND